MRIVKTRQDIELLKDAKALPEEYLKHIEDYFDYLEVTLKESEAVKNFSLSPHGYFVIIERGDNVMDMSTVGLAPSDGGLLGAPIEFVNLHKLGDLHVYHILVMYDNEYGMNFFMQAGIHGIYVETCIKQYITEPVLDGGTNA